MITTTLNRPKNYTVHTCFGRISAKKIMEKMDDYYKTEPTKHVIWDFEDASISHLTTEDIFMLVEFPKRYLHLRPGGTTSIVASEHSSFGVSRMYQSYAEVAQLDTRVLVFRSLKDALNFVVQTA